MLLPLTVRISIISLTLVGIMFGCAKLTRNLDQGLEEEKSYTRASMEGYRKNPNAFHGNKNVLETWSKADYIALAVAKQNKERIWADTSDKLNYLESNLQRDPTGSPFCVIQQEDRIVVLSIRSGVTSKCTLDLAGKLGIERIKSGDLDFSGSPDYWVYVFSSGRPVQP